MHLSPAQREALLDAARHVIRERVGGVVPEPLAEPEDPALLQPAGCFVSLHDLDSHQLRGCVGCLESSRPLWRAVQESARSVLEDPRFPEMPVTVRDLPNLELEVTVLSPLKPAASALDFEPLLDGIYLTIDGRSGCFLPQVARETGWSREQLLERLCTEKMELPRDSWKRTDASLQKFTVIILGPEPFAKLPAE